LEVGVDAATASFGVFIPSLATLVSDVVVDFDASKMLFWAAEDEEERGDDCAACRLSLA
jgi:hypothetical protein